MISLRPQSINFQSSWEKHCCQQLKSLFNLSETCGASISSIQLYSRIYELCISFPENHTMTLLKNIAQMFFDSAVEIRQEILNSQSGAINNTSSLGLYVKGWKRYYTAFKAINGVCRYLNKCLRANYETAQYPGNGTSEESSASSPGLHFQPVVVQVGEDKTERIELRITSIEDVAKSVWNNMIIRYFRERDDNILVKNFLFSLRQQDTCQEDLKSFIESFSRWCEDLNLLVNVEADTKEYYARVSEQYISTNNISLYVQFASGALTRETERVNHLWEPNTSAMEIIMKTCEMELIEKHKVKLEEEFEKMLQFERHTELNLLFKLLGKNEGASLALQQCFSQLIVKDFDRLYNVTGQSCDEIINQIKLIQQKYVKFIELAFFNDEKMQNTLQESMSLIINRKIKNSCKLFSTFINENLNNIPSINQEFFELVGLFSSATESFDEFIIEYKDKLSHRIVYNSTIDVQAEEKMLEIFKVSGKMSPEQNFHLNRMLLDYKERKDASVLVLTSHAWPANCNPINIEPSSLPDDLNQIVTKFEDEFKNIHCGRRLQWCPQLITLETANNTRMSLLQYQIIASLPFKSDIISELSEKFGRSLNEVHLTIKTLQDYGIILLQNELYEFIDLPANLNLIPISEDHAKSGEAVSLDQSNDNNMSAEIDASRQIRQSFILQSLITTILKKQRQASPAELKKLLITSAGSLRHGHSFLPQTSQIDEAVNGLIGKGYMEFNDHENLYIYSP